MTRTASPLRYPGGKSALFQSVSTIIRTNGLEGGHYMEPFAGGAGLALGLLFSGTVSHLHLNDVDRGIACLWQAILDKPEKLIDRLRETKITIDEWHRQREVVRHETCATNDDLAFATLFLNRTNRSGIIKGGGVIGGLRQTGNYLLDCRFNKDGLAERIIRISKYRRHITFTSMDALDLLNNHVSGLPERSLICADPPYYQKGRDLYTSFYNEQDHFDLSVSMLSVERPWIVTYDNCEPIAQLYKTRRQYEFSVNYSAQTKRIGSELLITSPGLRIPRELPFTQRHRPSRQ